MIGQWEWIILLLGFLALLVWERRNIRRAIRAAKDKPDKPEEPGKP